MEHEEPRKTGPDVDYEQSALSHYTAGDIKLSESESEILQHVVAGATYAEMATKMNMTVKTLKDLINAVSKKLGARTRSELAVIAVRNGYVK